MTTADQKAWEGFVKGNWCDEIDVRDFIQLNYTPYEGDASFLAGPTEKTLRVWNTLEEKYLSEERKVRILDIDTDTPADIDAFKPGYICEDDDVIVGLQTDAPLKRAMMPNGGWRMVETAIHEAGMEYNPEVKKIFTKYRKTHNDAVFDIYTPRIRAARSSHIITGLPDAYGRGRIIGDYRRVALYGVDHLIAEKEKDKDRYANEPFSEHWARYREEHSEQIKALKKLKNLAQSYGYDISGPATNAHEAVQWTYFGYLASVKSQDGAAMSIGRLSGFFDVYFERDLKNGTLDESGAQEIIDALVIKLRITRFLRTIAYDQIFSGDPYWATWSDAGFGDDGRTLVTKTSFRLLQTLVNLGPAPRAEHHHLLGREPAPRLQGVLRPHLDRHLVDSVRVRSADPRPLGRRRRHRLLRLPHEGRQADAVLRRSRERREGPALRHQRWSRRDERQAGHGRLRARPG